MFVYQMNKMKLLSSSVVLVLVLGIQSSASTEDLLDQYVRHVEKVSGDDSEMDSKFQNPRHSARKISFQQRNSNLRRTRRSSEVQDVQEDLNQWTHAEFLDARGDVLLRWQPRHQEIAFRVEARTRGYVGIGFSPNGGMKNADMVLGWVDDHSNQPFLLDYHGGSEGQGYPPLKDEIDNYNLIRGYQNDTHTVLEFRRALDTCDAEDYVLGTDTTRVIWALHNADPIDGLDIPGHGYGPNVRGSQSLYLLGPPKAPSPSHRHQVRQWDVTLNNFEVPNNMDTLYWCKIFKAPTLQTKHHIIGYEPLIGPNHRQFVHHMLLHECQLGPNSGKAEKWDNFANQPGQPCYGQNMPPQWENCLTPVVVWAIGSKGEYLPNHVGLPLGSGQSAYYMLEVHYDNPSLKKATDMSGLRLHYSHHLRPNEAGIFATGVTVSPLHVVPPRQPEYRSAGLCSFDCTREVFPRDGIKIVSVLLHSHLAGKKLKLRHLRQDKELTPIVQDNDYDFNYQQTRVLPTEVTVLPGDGLLTECTYKTVSRSKLTLGGYSTTSEMCLAFVLHYPRVPLAGCYSMPPVSKFFEVFGVKEFYGKNMKQVEAIFLQEGSEIAVLPQTSLPPKFPAYVEGDEMSPEANRRAIAAIQNAKDYTIEGESGAGEGPFDKLVIKEPREFRNKSFMSHLQEIPWTEELLTKKIEESFYKEQHLTFCRKRDDTFAVPEAIEMLPKFDKFEESNATKIQCSYRMHNSYSSGARILYAKLTFYLLPLYFLCSLLEYHL